jgi:Ca2+-transporting ATPase
MINYYSKSANEVANNFSVNPASGLSSNQAISLISSVGQNKLPDGKVDGIFTIFLRQFYSPLIYILLVAGVIVFLLGEIVDGIVILAVLIFNALVGTFQEGKAQNTLLALRRFVETKANVIRDSRELIISDTEIVPGDLILLNEGEKVPADARLIISNGLKVNESSLTGESEPVSKMSDVVPGDSVSVSDQGNMVFKGTNVVSGNGRAIVVVTGTNTVIGKIAVEIQNINTDMPLKKNIEDLSRKIIIIVIAISLFVFALGLFYGKGLLEMFKTVVSLAVSIIPEGLPVVVTLILATGVMRMGKKNALVKKLQAVEALGQANIIAVDKTGTITKNELSIKKIYTSGKIFEVTGSGYNPTGDILLDDKKVSVADHSDILNLASILALTSRARVLFSETDKNWKVVGDPTDAAMTVFSEKVGLVRNTLEEKFPVLSELPFDYRLKYHAVLNKDVGGNKLSVVGAPESILGLTTKIRIGDKVIELEKSVRAELESIFHKLSAVGLRVIACAEKINLSLSEIRHQDIHGLCFAGFVAMEDTLRPEIFDSMNKARNADIRVVMITGDHRITAEALARQAGIFKDGDEILTGEEMDTMSIEEISRKLDSVRVFARVNPEHKLNLIKAFRAKGDIVAMTGDGVNDAPSLVAADLGVAMGVVGAEVSKEAADIVLLDDNFGTIVLAVEEGRNIYKTIKKVILYLFSTSLGEVLTLVAAIFLGLPLPLLAVQIIWLNFVTDGFLVLALALEKKDVGLLSGKFTGHDKKLVDRNMLIRMLVMALPMAIFTVYFFAEQYALDLVKAQTFALTLLAVFQWFNAINCHSDSDSVFKDNPLSNKYIVLALVTVAVLQALAVYNPLFQAFLGTTALSITDWIIIFVTSLSIILAEEIRKLFFSSRAFKSISTGK